MHMLNVQTEQAPKRRKSRQPQLEIPSSGNAVVRANGRSVALTNLDKLFWKKERITKGDLIRYYARISPYLLPHLLHRAMVMKRYPNGAAGEFFFMKRAPSHKPAWVETCSIEHASGSIIDFPVVNDLASLLWIINLGCIDLNQWYGRCDAIDQPDYLHFDLDPVPRAGLEAVRDAALIVSGALRQLKMKPLAKTTGSRGIHIYVPIERGPKQKAVWTFAKELAQLLAADNPRLLTAEYRKSKRPAGRILVDYNQNAWGRTLASVYSVRPRPHAPVSTPVTFEEIERGFEMEDFTIHTVPRRLEEKGDLWAPLLSAKGRFNLGVYL